MSIGPWISRFRILRCPDFGSRDVPDSETMVAERPRKKRKTCLNCMSSKSRLHAPILLLSVINSDQLYLPSFCWGEWLKVFFLDLYLYLIISKSTISRFWMCWNWKFIIFDERNILVGPHGPTDTILVLVEIGLIPCVGLLPYPPYNASLSPPECLNLLFSL